MTCRMVIGFFYKREWRVPFFFFPFLKEAQKVQKTDAPIEPKSVRPSLHLMEWTPTELCERLDALGCCCSFHRRHDSRDKQICNQAFLFLFSFFWLDVCTVCSIYPSYTSLSLFVYWNAQPTFEWKKKIGGLSWPATDRKPLIYILILLPFDLHLRFSN